MQAGQSVHRVCPIVLIVPPFHWINRPHLGVHLLQGIARRAGVEAKVIYANILYASRIGQGAYDAITNMNYWMFAGERLFARAAYGLPPLGRDGGEQLGKSLERLRVVHDDAGKRFNITIGDFERLEAMVEPWVESLAESLGGSDVIGCSSSFEQNASSVALLSAVKRVSPYTTTIIGGANCEGPMAAGILGLSDSIDCVFSGESEETFRELVEQIRDGRKLRRGIYEGRPCEALDELPIPDYSDYYDQLRAWLPGSDLAPQLTFETSRGCWWGEKKHCTFCGLNGQGMASREKSAERALGELGQLLESHPNRYVTMTDNIMPHSYWKTVIPRLPEVLPGLQVMYEQKANLTLAQVSALARAGITEIQPGIEAISTGLLKLMDKGTTAAQNIALLRYARALDISLHWNLLQGFPGDKLTFYLETLELIPLLRHLPPPMHVARIVIDRFSPYHTFPDRYGLSAIEPIPGYRDVVPPHADVDALSYHFTATYASEALAHPEVIERIEEEVKTWRELYFGSRRPELSIIEDGDAFVLIDTRGLGDTSPHQRLTRAQASMALTQRRVTPEAQRELAWALAARIIVARDGRFVPLATASPALITELATPAPEPLQVVA